MLTNNDNPATNPRFIIGAGIAIFGLVLMLDRLHVVDAGFLLRFWPLVIIAIGVQRFFNPRHGRSSTQAIVWMAIGGWLLLNSLGALSVSIWEMFWPIALIWFGAHLMQQKTASASAPVSGAPDAADHIFIVSVMSGVKRSSSSTNFRGGEVTAFMGGAQIDLRQATIPPGQEATIEILSFMGGFEIIVPNTWVVVTPLIPIMGGVDDKRLAPPPGAADLGGQAAPRLALRGFVMMGGVKLRN